MDENVWQTVDQLLAYHQKPGRDLTPEDALNRLFARHVRRERLRGMPRLERATCSVSLESWPVEDLDRRLVRWHGKARPRYEDYPIVVAACDGRYFVLDGNNRTNKWAAEDRAKRHDVIVVRPHVVASARPILTWTERCAGAWRAAFARLLGGGVQA